MEQRAGHITPTNRTLNGRNDCLLVLGSNFSTSYGLGSPAPPGMVPPTAKMGLSTSSNGIWNQDNPSKHSQRLILIEIIPPRRFCILSS